MNKKIGIIGFGNMGSAIAEQLKADYQIAVFDKDKNKTENLKGINVALGIAALIKQVDVVILAVKPQDFDVVLNELKTIIDGKLIISIAAGISTAYIEKVLGKVKVIRVMPNLPVKVKEGMSCLCKGKFVDGEDLEFAEDLFKRVGKTLIVDNEDMMDDVTAISGSGPGFLCDLVEGKSLKDIQDFTEHTFIPSLTATATNLGFSPQQAKILAEITGRGTVVYLEKEHLSPEEVKKQVTSKKGTTEAGLQELKHDIKNLSAAVRAAWQRAKELSREE